MTAHKQVKPGRKHFFESLRGRCRELAREFFARELSHDEFLEARAALTHSITWERATAMARIQAFAYLEGVEQAAFATRAIVWKHRWDGEWVDSGDARINYQLLDPSESRWVWARTNKVYLVPSGAREVAS